MNKEIIKRNTIGGDIVYKKYNDELRVNSQVMINKPKYTVDESECQLIFNENREEKDYIEQMVQEKEQIH